MSKTAGPFLEVARIQSEINHLFENLSDLGRASGDAGEWVPNVDVIETPEALLVDVELPGVSAHDLSVTAGGGLVHVSGVKARSERIDGARVRAAERSYGRFRRSIQLGVAVNTRRADARLVDGLLRIRFPKVPNRRGEEVEIEVRP